MTHDNPAYVNLADAMEKVGSLRDPAEDHLGVERPGWVAAINYVLSTLEKLPRDAR